MLKSLFSRGPSIPASKLPSANAFVDVVVAGRASRSVSVDAVTAKGIVVRGVIGRPGESAVLLYDSGHGRLRAATKITGASGERTTLAMPDRVTPASAATGSAGGGGAQKRQTVRLDALVPGTWRFAPGGKGTGEFVKANIRDISRGGCSLILDRELKRGTSVEVQLRLREGGAPLVLLGEVMRQEHIASSGRFSHGLRFHGIRPEEDHAIVEFINRKQAELRSRGLA
ncbi:MAG: PilZ domain-containing protein [Candidatus Eremiobacteraeota bacterium]|nr:PilZ domain-containing protein [Candidatus Eremiobacteraeota bacterium]